MKRRRLKKWVKVLITFIIAIIGLFIYVKTGILGELAQDSNIYLVICITAWAWLLFGQFSLLYFIWEEIWKLVIQKTILRFITAI